MSTDEPSRLHRVLGATGPLLEVRKDTPDGEVLVNDSGTGIVRATISRGGSPAGLVPTVATLTLASQEHAIKFDPASGVFSRRLLTLTDHALDCIDALSPGPGTRAQIAPRFYGSPAAVELADTGDRRSRWITTSTMTDALSRIRLRDRGTQSTHAGGLRGSDLSDVARNLLRRAGLMDLAGVADFLQPDLIARGSGWHYVKHTAADPDDIALPTTSGLEWIESSGHLLNTRRGGVPVLTSHTQRTTDGRNLAAITPASNPLTRAQVLAPIRWTKEPGTARRLRVTITKAVGGLSTWTVAPEGPQLLLPETDVDLTALVGDQLPDAPAGDVGPVHAFTAQLSRETPIRWGLERVRVDLLDLFGDDRPTHRAQARRLLGLEIGDPLILTHDWPVADVFYVTRLDETITPDNWYLELELGTFAQITGQPSPAIPAGETWNTRWPLPTTWDAIPGDPTWDEI